MVIRIIIIIVIIVLIINICILQNRGTAHQENFDGRLGSQLLQSLPERQSLWFRGGEGFRI